MEPIIPPPTNAESGSAIEDFLRIFYAPPAYVTLLRRFPFWRSTIHFKRNMKTQIEHLEQLQRLRLDDSEISPLSTEQIESIVAATQRWRKGVDLSQELQLLRSPEVSREPSPSLSYRMRAQDAATKAEPGSQGAQSSEDAQKSAEEKTKLDGYWDVVKQLAKDHPFVAATMAILGLVAGVFIVLQGTTLVGQAWPILLLALGLAYVAVAVGAARKVLHGKILSPVRAFDTAIKNGTGTRSCRASEEPPPRLRIRKGGWELWLVCPSAPQKRKFLIGFDAEVIPL